jgi:hypothetical protein
LEARVFRCRGHNHFILTGVPFIDITMTSYFEMPLDTIERALRILNLGGTEEVITVLQFLYS